MKLTVAPEIFSLFPNLHLVVVVVRGVDNGGSSHALRAMLDHEQEITRTLFAAQHLSDHPNIIAWRAAYRGFGSGDHYRSSVEAIARRVVKGGALPSINPLVDSYNCISLKYLIPIGGEDCHKIHGDLTLRRAVGGEPFVPLGKTETESVEPGEVGYFDAGGCLCRRCNWRESDRTKLTAMTTHAMFTLEGLPPVGEIDLKDAAYSLVTVVKEQCGGTAECLYLHKNMPTMNCNV